MQGYYKCIFYNVVNIIYLEQGYCSVYYHHDHGPTKRHRLNLPSKGNVRSFRVVGIAKDTKVWNIEVNLLTFMLAIF